MTKPPSLSFKRYDVVVVPFPFAENGASKRRPAVILSQDARYHKESGCVLAAMITSATHQRWSSDVAITDLKRAGLKRPCVIRMKLFTLDQRLILDSIGTLAKKDQAALDKSVRILME